MLDLYTFRPELERLCKKFSVRRLDLVGSAARDDFCPGTSDIDVLIEFEGNDALFDRYFSVKSALEDVFGHQVDLIQAGALKNPHLRASLEEDKVAIYEA